MHVTFDEVQIGNRFRFRGQTYTKIALSMAADERGCGWVFGWNKSIHDGGEPGAHEVEPITETEANHNPS